MLLLPAGWAHPPAAPAASAQPSASTSAPVTRKTPLCGGQWTLCPPAPVRHWSRQTAPLQWLSLSRWAVLLCRSGSRHCCLKAIACCANGCASLPPCRHLCAECGQQQLPTLPGRHYPVPHLQARLCLRWQLNELCVPRLTIYVTSSPATRVPAAHCRIYTTSPALQCRHEHGRHFRSTLRC